MKLITLAFVGIASGCVSQPKCLNTSRSETVFEKDKACVVRIRQVTVLEHMDLPKSVKASDFVTWNLQWIDSRYQNGQVEAGHFVLSPTTGGKN